MRKGLNKELNAAYLMNEQLIDDELTLTEEEQQAVKELYNAEQASFHSGEVISGKILEKSGDGVVVDVAFKSYGTIPNYEFNKPELEKFKVGDSIEVLLDRLENEDGNIVVSYQKAKSMKAWDRIVELAKNDEPVVGTVLNKVKGGLSVDIGIPAFLPGSQVDVQRVTDFDQFIGQEIECKIIKVNKKRGNVIISRRKFLEVARMALKSKVLEKINEGDVLQGIAKNITNYGVFIDIGGVDGLLHITDMSWGRVNHPSELVKIGDQVSVKVIGLDKEHEKISLGMKQLVDNPWENVEARYPVGNKITGKISSITDYGLFVEVEKGIEGLVHISEVSWTERITNLSRHYSVGQEIEIMVVALDKENRRMSLSVKQLSQDPWKAIAEQFNINDKVTGTVSNVTDFGVFIELADGIDGLVHVSDISWTDHITNPSEKYKRGDKVDAVVLAMDTENRKISLGVKQLSQDPWEVAADEYPVGKIVTGTVSKETSFGVFVRLENGIEGLVHSSEINKDEASALAVGTTREFRVARVSSDDRKIALSTKLDGPIERAEKKREAAPKMPKAPQIKSVLQQALEEHAARTQNNSSDKG